MEEKKGSKKWLIPVAVIAALAAIIGGVFFALSQDETLNMEDVYATLKTVLPYFIPFAILVIAAIAAAVVMKKKWSAKKHFMLKAQSAAVCALAFVVTVNVVCFGPMATMLNLTFAEKRTISDEVKAESAVLAEEIANQGTVLLKNENNMLPLADKKINVFGWASTNPCYGGTGSGSIDTTTCVTLLSGLTNAGFELNTQLSDFYTAYRADRPVVGMWEQDWTFPEPKADTYTPDMMQSAKDFSDKAMIVITRVGGEGADLPIDMSKVTYNGNEGDFEPGQHYLELSKTEKEMIDLVTSNFKDVVVLYNGSNAMELGWVNEYDSIKSVLWLAGPGQEGFNALGKVLSGDLNPSGRTVDTFVYDLTKTPVWNNFGEFAYENPKGYHFINYVEGIYGGYHFYETFYLNQEEEYQKSVLYPFGYGLSYSEFTQKMSEVTADGTGNLSFDVTVTNTGSVTGKDVVQAYYTAPYTNGGIEKSAVELLDFAKTDDLAPGESQTVSFTFNQEEMASYDTYGQGCYVLEPGNYELKIMANSHEMLDSKSYTVDSLVTYNESNPRSTDKEVAVNTFEDFTGGEVTYLSRKDNFANYEEATKVPSNYQMDEKYLAELSNVETYEIPVDEADTMPVTGAKNGMKLYDLLGKDYEDPMWETLLDQMTVEEMKNLVAMGGYQTKSVDSVKKLATLDADGPAGFSSFFNKQIKGTPFPGATIIAATWNKELAYQRGVSMAKEAQAMGVSGWYAPAMNIHRSAFSGRNFEYYSEDGVLSAKMAAKEVKGAQENGLYAYIKHFALNDQESKRCDMLCTWSNEQAIRQVYLKPFEAAVKEGGATAAMSSFNYIGNKWAGGCPELLNEVLRGEWGFRGMVLTDYFGGYGYMDADKAIRNGNDCMLSPLGESGAIVDDASSATAVKAMRTAAHNIMYTVVNSNAYYDYKEGLNLTPWMKVAVGVDILLAVLLVGSEVLVLKNYKKKEEA